MTQLSKNCCLPKDFKGGKLLANLLAFDHSDVIFSPIFLPTQKTCFWHHFVSRSFLPKEVWNWNSENAICIFVLTRRKILLFYSTCVWKRVLNSLFKPEYKWIQLYFESLLIVLKNKLNELRLSFIYCRRKGGGKSYAVENGMHL